MSVHALQHREDLVMTETQDDLLVYDPETHALHTLNPVLAKVFRRCDGTVSIEDLVQKTGLGEDAVRLAVAQLHEAGLLEGTSPIIEAPVGSRRRFLRNVGIGASLPVITSVTVPMASAAASVTCTPSGEPCDFGNPGACCSMTCWLSVDGPVCM